MRINERWAPTWHTLQHKAFCSCSWGWRHSQHDLPANMKQGRRRRGAFTLDLPLHNKAEDRAGKCCCFRWPGWLRCRALRFLLREKRMPKALSGITLSSHPSLYQLCFCLCVPAIIPHWRPYLYISLLVSHISLISSLTYLLSSPLHAYLLWFSEQGGGNTVLEREVWPRRRGCPVRGCLLSPCMQGGGEMGLDRKCWGSSHTER